jgi:hypothetical protein
MAELEAGAQATRYKILSIEGWFRASQATQVVDVNRGTVRDHARAMVDAGLLKRREASGPGHKTFEWLVTRRGRLLYAGLKELLDGAEATTHHDAGIPTAFEAIVGVAPEGASLCADLESALREKGLSSVVLTDVRAYLLNN